MGNGMTDGDYWILTLKILATVAVILVLGLVVIKPWLVPNKTSVAEKDTSLMIAQKTLLKELEDCGAKYGSDYKSYNQQYCDSLLLLIKDLVEMGKFDSPTELAVVQTNITSSVPPIARGKSMEEIRDIVREIAGDI